MLLVEDDLEVRKTSVRVLGAAYQISLADSGETALWRFESGERFDVVLCDIHMPKMNADVLVDRIRRIDPAQARRLIMITANMESPLVAKVSDYYILEKPFEAAKLRELIDRVSAAARDDYFP